MAVPTSAATTGPKTNAISLALLVVCFALCIFNVSMLQSGLISHWWIFDENGLGIPTDFVNSLHP